MTRMIELRGRLGEFMSESGSMAVEFALVAPLLIFLVMGTINFGMAFNMKLRLLTAAGAGVAYAQMSGGSVTSSNFAAFADAVATAAQGSADFGDTPPKVVVGINNTTDGSAADGYYCVSGSPPTWRVMADALSDCGSNVTAGKFVTVTLSTSVAAIFPTAGIVGNVIPLEETIVARVQ